MLIFVYNYIRRKLTIDFFLIMTQDVKFESYDPSTFALKYGEEAKSCMHEIINHDEDNDRLYGTLI
jgi:hypothetical protein